MLYGLKVLSLGGFSLLMIGFWTFFKPVTASGLSFHNDIVLTVGTILALLIYQPHFVSAYTMNYGKGFRYVSQHPLVFITLPLFFLLLILLTLLQSLGFLSLISEVFYKVFFAATLLGAAYHFSAQSMAATKYLRSESINTEAFFLKGKLLLFVTGVFGIFHHASMTGGSFRLFNFSLELFKIEADLLLFLKLGLLLLHFLFIYRFWKLSFSWVPYIAYV